MWRENISHACNVVNLNDVRLLGIDVDIIEGKILPYQYSDNYEEYCNYLGKIGTITEEKNCSKIVIARDFNDAAVISRFETELLNICNNFDLDICDYEVFGRNQWDLYLCQRCPQLYILARSLHLFAWCPITGHEHTPYGQTS